MKKEYKIDWFLMILVFFIGFTVSSLMDSLQDNEDKIREEIATCVVNCEFYVEEITRQLSIDEEIIVENNCFWQCLSEDWHFDRDCVCEEETEEKINIINTQDIFYIDGYGRTQIDCFKASGKSQGSCIAGNEFEVTIGDCSGCGFGTPKEMTLCIC